MKEKDWAYLQVWPEIHIKIALGCRTNCIDIQKVRYLIEGTLGMKIWTGAQLKACWEKKWEVIDDLWNTTREKNLHEHVKMCRELSGYEQFEFKSNGIKSTTTLEWSFNGWCRKEACLWTQNKWRQNCTYYSKWSNQWQYESITLSSNLKQNCFYFIPSIDLSNTNFSNCRTNV